MTDLDDESIYFDFMPMDLSRILSPFEKLLVIKVFKPQKLMGAVTRYIKKELGEEYAVSPHASLESLFQAADNITPIIFVL